MVLNGTIHNNTDNSILTHYNLLPCYYFPYTSIVSIIIRTVTRFRTINIKSVGVIEGSFNSSHHVIMSRMCYGTINFSESEILWDTFLHSIVRERFWFLISVSSIKG